MGDNIDIFDEQRRFFAHFAFLYIPWFAITTAIAASPLAPRGMIRFGLCTVAIVIPIAVFVVAYRRSPGLRATVVRLDLSCLHFFQIARMAGIGMLALYAVGRLAAPFALWAGGIDVFIGLTATFVAFIVAAAPQRPRSVLIAWNVLGLLDFVVALVIWFLWSPTSLGLLADSSDTGEMLRLPMSFIPMAGVPIASIAHIIALIQLTRANPTVPNAVLHHPEMLL